MICKDGLQKDYDCRSRRSDQLITIAPTFNCSVYSGLQINSSFVKFEKISINVVWVNIKIWLIPYLKHFNGRWKLLQKQFQKSQGYWTFRYDFRYAKIDKISNLNNFAKSKYFFLKLYIQRARVYPVSPYEF